MENPKLTTDQRVRIVCEIIERGLDTDNRSIEDICKANRTYSSTVQKRVGEEVYRNWLQRKAELRKRMYLQRIAAIFQAFKDEIDKTGRMDIKAFCKKHHVSYSSLRAETNREEMNAYILKANPSARIRNIKPLAPKKKSRFFEMPPSEDLLFIGKFYS